LQKLRNHPAYFTLFKAAYGNDSITTSRFLKALSQFMNMLISDNSKYDKVMRGEGGTSFTQEEQEGYALFKEHCAACHTEPLFTNLTYADNGLGATPNDDKGRYEITLRPEDLYTFKIPSLRNSMLTAPYMHNGSIRNMDGVLEHYTTGLQASPNLHPLLKNPATGQPQPIALNATQKQQLKAFLNTLSDEAFIRNKIFSEP
ncbi:MAG TPA: cytochrome c peroxidase, partial [Phnomibacter sp.]|nr:cytochrome c peroxidase [Phnomibacter sp.]